MRTHLYVKFSNRFITKSYASRIAWKQEKLNLPSNIPSAAHSQQNELKLTFLIHFQRNAQQNSALFNYQHSQLPFTTSEQTYQDAAINGVHKAGRVTSNLSLNSSGWM